MRERGRGGDQVVAAREKTSAALVPFLPGIVRVIPVDWVRLPSVIKMARYWARAAEPRKPDVVECRAWCGAMSFKIAHGDP